MAEPVQPCQSVCSEPPASHCGAAPAGCCAAATPAAAPAAPQHAAFLSSWRAHISPRLQQLLVSLQAEEVATSLAIAQVGLPRPYAHRSARPRAPAPHPAVAAPSRAQQYFPTCRRRCGPTCRC